ncbi:hypothetical protein [Saccharothrix sp. Mg75]|uniref:hypothetical protein n=1 Tax=Saccharothrix sp. Mg75 TaxID=3445357 RepID=UPI003EED52CB
MSPLAKWTVVALSLTVLAVLVPWSHYGQVDVELSRLPRWWLYLGAAALLHACALLPARSGPVPGLVVGAVALAAAVLVASGYDGASWAGVVPVAVPRPGLGVLFAAASVVAQVVGLRARTRVPVG